MSIEDFSFQTRKKALQRFRNEVFDFLIIGGGITGAAVARDATSRGLKVALVERRDFAFGTSSRSSKLIHGGLRYLQNMEMGLVFEALSERALLLKTAPHMVRPLPFFLPVYKGDVNGRCTLSLGLMLYDLLALFRTPGFHQGLSRKKLLSQIPFLKPQGLLGGFRYFDASMWDDALTVETLRCAQAGGASVANYIEAVRPIWTENRIAGFVVKDLESPSNQNEWNLNAHRTIICAGPWTDQLGGQMTPQWNRWLKPSKGVHLIFDLKKIPLPGAMVMSHPEDGRIVFVIPRPDYGAGVVIVGTTDGPTSENPDHAEIHKDDIAYLMGLLTQYFPHLKLTQEDILSAYVGVRPLMDEMGGKSSENGNPENSSILQKVSREHHIDEGPGGTVIVAGGKYTTHRKMAEEIVDFALKSWRREDHPLRVGRSDTRSPVNPQATADALKICRDEMVKRKIELPEELLSRYGAGALSVWDLHEASQKRQQGLESPIGFPLLEAQLRYSIRSEMVMHLEDFYLRRVPLFATRKDHGLPWADQLAQVWAEERGCDRQETLMELERLKKEFSFRSVWRNSP